MDTLLDSGLMPTNISSITDQDGVPPEDESRDEGSNETKTLGILQPPGVEELLSSAPEAPDLTGVLVPDLGSASLLDSEGADPAPEQETAKVTPEGNTSHKQRDPARPRRDHHLRSREQRDPARPRRDRHLRSRVRPPERLF